MESSKKPVRLWLYVMYKISVSRKGISSLQLAEEINVPQNTAWFMLQRLKEACGNKHPYFSGVVQSDETFLGGKEANRHASKKLGLGRGGAGKQAVLGLKEEGGEVMAKPIPNTDTASIVGNIQEHVEPGATIYSDEHPAYRALPKVGYEHKSVAHSRGEYARGAVNVNAVENAWSQVKRTILGVHHHISDKHTHRYLDGMCYRLNEGNVKFHVKDRIAALCRLSAGARIKWKELIK